MSRSIPADQRIEPYIERIPWSGCWLWLKSLNNAGYGTVAVKGKSKMAHRFSFEFYSGPIPKGHLVLHRCDTPSCVNPEHLFTGTQSDNQNDAQLKGRRYKQPSDRCLHGHPSIAENIYFYHGHRYCLLCKRESRRRHKV